MEKQNLPNKEKRALNVFIKNQNIKICINKRQIILEAKAENLFCQVHEKYMVN